jgi:hypothetical protein
MRARLPDQGQHSQHGQFSFPLTNFPIDLRPAHANSLCAAAGGARDPQVGASRWSRAALERLANSGFLFVVLNFLCTLHRNLPMSHISFAYKLTRGACRCMLALSFFPRRVQSIATFAVRSRPLPLSDLIVASFVSSDLPAGLCGSTLPCFLSVCGESYLSRHLLLASRLLSSRGGWLAPRRLAISRAS